ncbi:MAG: alpha/beta fold hydrolase [Bacilli bacterium]
MFKRQVNNASATLLIVHGLYAHHARYRSVVGECHRRGYNVFVGDLPGHGMQMADRGDIADFDQYVETLKLWIEEARSWGAPVILFGQSFGAIVIMRYMQEKLGALQQEGISQIILSCPALKLQSPPIVAKGTLLHGLAACFPFMNLNVESQAEYLTRNREEYFNIKNDPMLLRRVTLRWCSAFQRVQYALLNKEINSDVSTKILIAEYDEIVDNEVIKAWFEKLHCPTKQLFVLSNCFHELLLEPEYGEVFDLISESSIGTNKGE